MSDTLKADTLALVAEIDQRELAVRFLEIIVEAKRPDEVTASEVLEDMEAAAATNPALRMPLYHAQKMAVVAIEFMGEAVKNARRAQ